MTVLSGENRRPAWRTDGVGYKTVIKSDAFVRDPIDIRCLNRRTPVATDRLFRVVITHNKQDIRTLSASLHIDT